MVWTLLVYERWEALDILAEALHCEDDGGQFGRDHMENHLCMEKACGLSTKLSNREFSPCEGLQLALAESVKFPILSKKDRRAGVSII
jgi:hypothetical protein